MWTARTRTLLIAVVVVGSTAALAVASPTVEARPFCPVCDGLGGAGGTETARTLTFETALAQAGQWTNPVDRSTLEVRLHPNGTAIWTARNRLRDPTVAEKLRRNVTLRRRVLDRIEFGATPVGEPSNPTMRIANETAIVRLRDPDGATRGLGDVVFLAAHKTSRAVWWELNADEVTLTAPAGWAVTHAPRGEYEGHRIEDGAVIWESDDDGEASIGRIVPFETYAFAPSGGSVATVFTHANRVLGAVPAAATLLVVDGWLPVGLFALAMAALGSGLVGTRRFSRRISGSRFAFGVLGAGGLVVLASSLYRPLVVIGLVYLVVGGGGYAVSTLDGPVGTRILVLVALLGVVLPMMVWKTLLAPQTTVVGIMSSLPLLGMIAAGLPFGRLATSTSRLRYAGVGLSTAIFALALVGIAAPSFTAPQELFFVVAGIGLAAVGCLAAAPLAFLGVSLSAPGERS